MREIGVLEAKTHFTSLIAEVERTGEEIVITRHGKAAVRIAPVNPSQRTSEAERRAVAEEVLAWRDAQPFDEELAATGWDELKKAIRDDDRHG